MSADPVHPEPDDPVHTRNTFAYDMQWSLRDNLQTDHEQDQDNS